MSHTIGQIKQNNQQLNNSSQVDRDSLKPEERTRSPMPISDVDFEFLFNQLLEGIAHGWHDRRIVKFFVRLGDRADQKDWVAWLERLRDKASVLPPQSKRQLGAMMIRLGELTYSTTEVDKISTASHRIGKELLFGNIDLWEYVGPDLSPEARESELAERLPTDFDAISSDGVAEEIESAKFTAEPDPAESRLNSVEQSGRGSQLPTSRSAIPDKLEADLVDPESIPQTKQTTSNTTFSESESGLSSSSSNPKIVKTNSHSDKLQDIAGSIHTGSQIEAFDLSQVINLIQEDEELARQISQKLNRAIAKENTAPLDRKNLELIESWFNLGLKQVSLGKFTNAIASWDKALNINPNLPEAWHNRGSALGRLGDYPAAIESFENALAIDPENYQAWNDRAHALYQLQNWTQAADSWSNAIKIMPGNHLFWYNRGCALEQLEKWEEAIASHEKALEIVPDFEPARSRYINLIADSSRSN